MASVYSTDFWLSLYGNKIIYLYEVCILKNNVENINNFFVFDNKKLRKAYFTIISDGA